MRSLRDSVAPSPSSRARLRSPRASLVFATRCRASRARRAVASATVALSCPHAGPSRARRGVWDGRLPQPEGPSRASRAGWASPVGPAPGEPSEITTAEGEAWYFTLIQQGRGRRARGGEDETGARPENLARYRPVSPPDPVRAPETGGERVGATPREPTTRPVGSTTLKHETPQRRNSRETDN